MSEQNLYKLRAITLDPKGVPYPYLFGWIARKAAAGVIAERTC